MVSSLVLERPGYWRALGLALIAAVLITPHLVLLRPVLFDTSVATLGSSFIRAIGNSALIAALAGVAGLAVGLALGVSAALYRFPGRQLLISIAVLTLLVPPFLWAIGWSSLMAAAGVFVSSPSAAVPMCTLVFGTGLVAPIVLLTAYTATAALTSSQLDALRLAGGERTVLWQAIGYAVVPALLAATFGAILTVADPGPGQVFGVRTAAADILTSHAALYDFGLAGRQCVLLVALILVGTIPVVFLAGPHFADHLLVRQVRKATPTSHRLAAFLVGGGLVGMALLGTIMPLIGLALPIARVALYGALSDAWRTAWTSVFYAAGGATVAMVIGFAVAVCVGRNHRMRTIWLAFGLALFCMPPAAPALAIVDLAARAPAWADPILRSRFTVCLALGLRFAPIFSVIALRAWATTAPSWTHAAALHGVGLQRYANRILVPLLAPVAGIGLILVALLALADVTTVLLIHPPGYPSLPLTIFTVMSNAPEAQVAALCLLYVALAAAGGAAAIAARGRYER